MVLLIGIGVVTWWRWPTPSSGPLESAPVMEPMPTFGETKPRVEYSPLRPRAVTNTPAIQEQRPVITNSFLLTTLTNELLQESNTMTAEELVAVPDLTVASPITSFNLCLSNMYQIVWAANVWCGVHGEILLPDNLMMLTNELATPTTLVCPGDPQWSQKATTNWAEFRPEWITYRLSPDAQARNRSTRVTISFSYLFCPVHKRWTRGDHPSPPGGWGPWWDSMNPGKSRFK
jgi:hypothetical protein